MVAQRAEQEGKGVSNRAFRVNMFSQKYSLHFFLPTQQLIASEIASSQDMSSIRLARMPKPNDMRGPIRRLLQSVNMHTHTHRSSLIPIDEAMENSP